MEAILRARIGSFSFHGDVIPVLRAVELEAVPGTLTAVLGGSGSGKSTLGRLLSGWLTGGHGGVLTGSLQLATGGTADAHRPLVFTGADDDPRIDSAAWAEHVGYVPQDPGSMLSTVRETVEEELAFGLENRGMARAEMRQVVAGTAERTGLAGLLTRNPATLSGGELRRLAIACAVVAEPGVLVLDEPLASLDEAGAHIVRELISGLLARGSAVVVLSQTADELTRAASHWLVLDDGTVTASGRPAGLLAGEELACSGVVLAEASEPPAQVDATGPIRSGGGVHAAAVLELERVSFGFGMQQSAMLQGAGPGKGRFAGVWNRPLLSTAKLVLQDVDLAVHPGEIVAVTGPNGAGKSTLLRLLNGLLRPAHGEVRINGTGIAGVPTGIIATELGLLFQHPRDQLFERTVLREVLFGLDRMCGDQSQARATAALAAVGLQGSDGLHPHELPASRQRLLALATVLAREPAVLALDEPTVGLDSHGLSRLGDAITAAAGRGAAVVMVTHNLSYARAHAHRTFELRGGRLLIR